LTLWLLLEFTKDAMMFSKDWSSDENLSWSFVGKDCSDGLY
jgi:hypothetical protein